MIINTFTSAFIVFASFSYLIYGFKLVPIVSTYDQRLSTSNCLFSSLPPLETSQTNQSALVPPTKEDMKHMAFLLANISDHLEKQPQAAFGIAAGEIGWLFSRDIPKLCQMLLEQFPALRKDYPMMAAFTYLLDFMDIISKETKVMLANNQEILKGLLQATKTSELIFDEYISANKEKVLSPEFGIYLDTEIENQEFNSAMENLLVTIKLRLLDEQGKMFGVDVMTLPKLAAEQDPAELKRKTIMYLSSYDKIGKELFLQTLRIMMKEMKKRYNNIDPIMIMNLNEIEKITQGMILNSK